MNKKLNCVIDQTSLRVVLFLKNKTCGKINVVLLLKIGSFTGLYSVQIGHVILSSF